MFKNVQLFRIHSHRANACGFEEAPLNRVRDFLAVRPSGSAETSTGFTQVLPGDVEVEPLHGAESIAWGVPGRRVPGHPVQFWGVLKARQYRRRVPASAVKAALDTRIAEWQRKYGEKPNKRVVRQLKDDARLDLLNAAPVGYIDVPVLLLGSLIIVDTASTSLAEDVRYRMAHLLDAEIYPVRVNASLVEHMTHWSSEERVATPAGLGPVKFSIGESFKCRGQVDKSSTLSGRNLSLSDLDIAHRLVPGGLEVVELDLAYSGVADETLPFRLTEKLVLKSIEWPPELMEQAKADAGESDDATALLYSTLLLKLNLLSRLTYDLVTLLGGELLPATNANTEA